MLVERSLGYVIYYQKVSVIEIRMCNYNFSFLAWYSWILLQIMMTWQKTTCKVCILYHCFNSTHFYFKVINLPSSNINFLEFTFFISLWFWHRYQWKQLSILLLHQWTILLEINWLIWILWYQQSQILIKVNDLFQMWWHLKKFLHFLFVFKCFLYLDVFLWFGFFSHDKLWVSVICWMDLVFLLDIFSDSTM